MSKPKTSKTDALRAARERRAEVVEASAAPERKKAGKPASKRKGARS